MRLILYMYIQREKRERAFNAHAHTSRSATPAKSWLSIGPVHVSSDQTGRAGRPPCCVLLCAAVCCCVLLCAVVYCSQSRPSLCHHKLLALWCRARAYCPLTGKRLVSPQVSM